MVTPDLEIWVTGMAWSTALGTDLDAVWAALLAGGCGIVDVPCPVPVRSTLGATVATVAPDLPAWDRQYEITGSTLSRAMQDAGIAPGDAQVQPVLGTSYGPHLEMPAAGSLSRWSVLAARDAGCSTEPVTVATACSAGSDAIAIGLTLLRQAVTDVCVCGGADVLTHGKRLGHSLLGTMAPDGLRAFDVHRTGTVLGEGAAFLVLEPAARARARGARPHGILAGAGASNDAANAVAPDPSGRNVALAVRRALQDAGTDAESVTAVNAHGSGTPANDEAEARAYTQVFGHLQHPPVLFATKGAFGHALGATGALEAVAVLLALRSGWVPPVPGLHQPLPGLGLPLPAGAATAVVAGHGISVTLGFGGFDTCLVFRGPEGVAA